MDEGLLTQITNDPEMDVNMGDDLQVGDPAVVGHPEPRVSSRERVSEANVIQRSLR